MIQSSCLCAVPLPRGISTTGSDFYLFPMVETSHFHASDSAAETAAAGGVRVLCLRGGHVWQERQKFVWQKLC